MARTRAAVLSLVRNRSLPLPIPQEQTKPKLLEGVGERIPRRLARNLQGPQLSQWGCISWESLRDPGSGQTLRERRGTGKGTGGPVPSKVLGELA